MGKKIIIIISQAVNIFVDKRKKKNQQTNHEKSESTGMSYPFFFSSTKIKIEGKFTKPFLFYFFTNDSAEYLQF